MIDFHHFGPELVHRFPVCQEIALRESVDLDGPERDGAYIIFGSVVHTYLEDLVEKQDFTKIASVMNFIGILAQENDPRWPELVQIEFGEWVYGYSQKALLEKFAGPETKRAMSNAERYFIQGQRRNESSPLAGYVRRIFFPKQKRQ